MTLYSTVGVGGGGWGGGQNEAIRLTKREVPRFDLQHCGSVFVLTGGAATSKTDGAKTSARSARRWADLKQYSRAQLLPVIPLNSARSLTSEGTPG